jgi:hypothetical protein
MKILTEALDLDYDEVRSYLYREQASVFDPASIKAREKLVGAQTDPKFIGQPFLPKENQPVEVPAPAPVAKKAGILSVKPLTDGTQTQINKGKPEKGGNPEMPNPIKDALDIEKVGSEEDKEKKELVSKTFGFDGTVPEKLLAKELVGRQYLARKKTRETMEIKKEEKNAQS